MKLVKLTAKPNEYYVLCVDKYELQLMCDAFARYDGEDSDASTTIWNMWEKLDKKAYKK